MKKKKVSKAKVQFAVRIEPTEGKNLKSCARKNRTTPSDLLRQAWSEFYARRFAAEV